jgi:hypothetical protein
MIYWVGCLVTYESLGKAELMTSVLFSVTRLMAESRHLAKRTRTFKKLFRNANQVGFLNLPIVSEMQQIILSFECWVALRCHEIQEKCL